MNTYSVDAKKDLKGHYFIFQLKETETARELLFMNRGWHDEHGKDISVANYDITYGGPLFGDTELDDIFTLFNLERPKAFRGHSLSVSDIIVMVTETGVCSYFVDSFGFSEIPEFLNAWNEREVELAFSVGNRFITIQTCTDGYEWNICNNTCKILDGGIYDDFEPSILEVLNGLIIDNLKSELDGVTGETYRRLKGTIIPESMLVPVLYDELLEGIDAAELDTVRKSQMIKEFREKTSHMFHYVDGLSAEKIEQRVLEHVYQVVGVTYLDSWTIDIETAVLVGSRSRGLEREDSDLDIVLEYTGSMKEYQLFNILNEESFYIGNVRVDINPIHADETGTLADYLPKAEKYLEQKKNSYFRVYWRKKSALDDEEFYAYARAYDETDAMKVAEACLNLVKYEVTQITPAKKHQITRQSLVLNCWDVLHELESVY